jgi:hypothetical protein
MPRACFFLVCLVLALLAGRARAAPVPFPRTTAQASPEECFLALQAAERKKDFKTCFAYLMADYQAIRAGHLLYMAAFEITVGRDRSGDLQKVMDRHQVSRQQLQKALEDYRNLAGRGAYERTARALSGKLADKPGFAADVMTALMKGRSMSRIADRSRITGVKVRGSHAELTVVEETGGNRIVRSIPCVRDGRRWRFGPPDVKSITPVPKK